MNRQRNRDLRYLVESNNSKTTDENNKNNNKELGNK